MIFKIKKLILKINFLILKIKFLIFKTKFLILKVKFLFLKLKKEFDPFYTRRNYAMATRCVVLLPATSYKYARTELYKTVAEFISNITVSETPHVSTSGRNRAATSC